MQITNWIHFPILLVNYLIPWSNPFNEGFPWNNPGLSTLVIRDGLGEWMSLLKKLSTFDVVLKSNFFVSIKEESMNPCNHQETINSCDILQSWENTNSNRIVYKKYRESKFLERGGWRCAQWLYNRGQNICRLFHVLV